jgi:hypothetical protein
MTIDERLETNLRRLEALKAVALASARRFEEMAKWLAETIRAPEDKQYVEQH